MNIDQWLSKENKVGKDIWKYKYSNNESFETWLDRVSNSNPEVKRLITEKKFLFGGRVLNARNVNSKLSYSNCYVIKPPEDNLEDIIGRTCTEMARTYSYGGGVGIDISNLRPKGTVVNNAAKFSSGAVSFMDLFNTVTETISQTGRRGALMICIDCTHPDIEEFIQIKSNLTKVNKANISVKITDEFLSAVEENKLVNLKYNDKTFNQVNAKDLFFKLAEMNWDYAEPGCLFWDRIQNYNFLDNEPQFKYAGTNPCAEEPLPSYGSCNLGSINLSAYIKEKPNTNKFEFDYKEFEKDVNTCVFALNDVMIEGYERHPLEKQRQVIKDLRQIGLGIMGLGDMLIKLGVTYGSKESLTICEKIAKTMINTATKSSVDYMNYRKQNFTEFNTPHIYYNIDTFKNSNFVKTTLTNETVNYVIDNGGMFNSQLLTCAPTGTLSTMLGITGGIEPMFAKSYERKTESLHGSEVSYIIYTPIVKAYMEENNITEEKDLPRYFICSHEIEPSKRIAMQAVWQKYIDASISSTVNLKSNVMAEDIFNLYIEAWKNGLKGITVYRDGCARNPILSDKSKKENKDGDIKRGELVKKDNLIGLKETLITGCGNLHCNVFFDDTTGELHEVFLGKGSKGGCLSNLNIMARMISLAARAGVSLEEIIGQLNSAPTCPSYYARTKLQKDTSVGINCSSAIANCILRLKEKIKVMLNLHYQDIKDEKKEIKNECPSCGEKLIQSGGCVECKHCGWTKCE